MLILDKLSAWDACGETGLEGKLLLTSYCIHTYRNTCALSFEKKVISASIELHGPEAENCQQSEAEGTCETFRTIFPPRAFIF